MERQREVVITDTLATSIHPARVTYADHRVDHSRAARAVTLCRPWGDGTVSKSPLHSQPPYLECLFVSSPLPLTFPRRDSLLPPAAELVGLSGEEEEEDEVDVDEDARPEAMPRGLVVVVPALPLGRSPPSSSSAASAAGCMTSHSPT